MSTSVRAPQVGTRYTLRLGGLFDMTDQRVRVHQGHRVVVVQPGHGAPRNGTLGHAYVSCLECGAEPQLRCFVGLVQLASLRREG